MAIGNPLFEFIRDDQLLPASNGGTWVVRNTHKALGMGDSDAKHIALFQGLMPNYYNTANSITLTIYGMAATGTTGTVNLDIEFERNDTGLDLDGDNFASPVSSTGTSVPATSGKPFVITKNLTAGAQVANIAPSELFRLRLTRKSADTLSGDYQLISVVGTEAA